MCNAPEYNSGFTLLELMITIAIAGIVLGVAIPSFTSTIASNRLTTHTNQLVTAINLARSEAVKRGLRVTLCKSADGATCVTTGDWSQGWIVFMDQNNNAAYDSATETLLNVQERAPGQITMTGNTSVGNYISYISSGQSQLTSGAFQAGTIQVCDNRTGDVGKNIVLSNTGRPRSESNITCP
ncbi:MAG: Tfp pilus assembly protein FimT/FimU [Methylobacter tundripaludum]|nr:Tfp pilus assembly protein FimT/FimU [Methylobacter tundripaludum]